MMFNKQVTVSQLRQIHSRVPHPFPLEALNEEVNSRHEAGAKQQAKDASNIPNKVVEVVHVDLSLNRSCLMFVHGVNGLRNAGCQYIPLVTRT